MSKPLEPDHETTLYVRDHCLCLATRRAARALGRHFDEVFRPLGISNGQFSLMMALNVPASPTIGAVAGVLAMDRTTLTAALKPLERRGLVAVAPDGVDRRTRRLRLTAEGRALLARAVPVWRQAHAALDAKVGSDGLVAGLGAVTAILGG